MPTVEIKGYGTRVKFPDTMTDAEIEAALRDKVMPQLKAETAASDRQALEAMTPYERAQVLERHRNGGAQTVGEAMTQLSGAAPAVSPPAGALTSTPEGAAPGSRSFGQAVRDTGHNALVALGEPARGRLSLPGLQVALRGLSTMPMPGANPAAMLSAYDRAAAAVLPEDVRPAPEGAGAWERALTETALPGLAAFADPVNMGAMVAGGALAAPVAGALGLGGVMASPIASAASKGAARALQAGLQNAGALGAFGGVEAAQRGEGLGGIASAAGRSAATGLELGATAGMPGGALGKLLGEVGIFGLAAPAMEGRMPTEDDLVGAIVMIGGLNAARGLSPGAIRGLLKRREQRTPEEVKAVDEIPPEQMQAIEAEIRANAPELATIKRAERIDREQPTSYQVQEAGGVPKATPLPRETPEQTKRLLAQVPDDVLLTELAREQQSDSRRRLLQEEFYRRTAAPEPEPQGEINQADILARQKKGRRLALAQSPTRSVTVGALKAGDRVKTVQGDGKVVKVTQNGVKVVTDAGATVSLFRGQRVRRYGEAGGAGAPEFSAPQERPAVEPRPLETALELQDYQEIVDLVPERAAREAVPRETPAEPVVEPSAPLGENAPPEVPISPKTEAVPRETPAEPVPGKKLPTGFVYHNTRGSELDAIAQEGMTAGSFSKRPIDFGGDSWIAVRRDDISGSIQEHPYGAEVALEPTWGEAAPGYSQTMPIPPDRLYLVDRNGRLIRKLSEPAPVEPTPAAEAPALPVAASEAPKPGKVPAPAAEGPQGAAEKPTAESSQAGFLNLEAFGAIANPDRAVKRTNPKGARGIREAAEGGLSPVSSRLRRIAPDLERRTRGLMHETGTATIAARDTAKGLQEGLLKMAREDGDAYTALEVALGQGDSARIAQMIERAGLQKQYQAVREYLDATRERMLDAGIEVGEVPGEYFPRRVRDYAGLMDHLGSEAAGEIGKQLKARADKLGVPVDALPPEIRDQIVNSYLRGRIPLGEGKPGMTKPRTIDNFTEDLLPFYYRPEEALAKYISTAEEAIARARFFGKGEDVTGSIGSYVADLIARGEIKPSQEREVKNALLSLFNRNPSWQFIRDTKNVTYAMTMGSTASAVTQVGDLAWSLYENGAYQTAKQAGKSILRKQGLSKQDIGIQDIASEFDSLGKSGKALDTLFKLTGLEQMDALGKETLINASLARARKQAKRIAAGKKDYAARRFQRDLDRYFGSEQEQILKDLASGETTEPVKFFLFNKLLDYQPVARSEMPQFYLEHPNMRIGYQLKSFTLKQMDAFRRESFDLIRDGARKGDRQMQIDGMRNLVRLGSFFVLANASADVIKDVMFGRGLPKADDLMWDNVLRLFGFSRYLTWRVRREGLGTAAAQFVGGPIVGKLDDAWKDGVRIHRGLTKSEYEVEWDKLRLLNSVPLVGAWAFWYKGQGADWIKEDAVKEAKENAPGVRPSRSSRPTRPTRQGR